MTDPHPPEQDAGLNEERRPRETVDAAARLLDRAPPEAYLATWKDALRGDLDSDDHRERFSAGIFRVGEELFALSTEQVLEVQPPVPVRSVPGRTNDVFRGIVSLRGEIHLCADLRALFGLEPAEDRTNEDEQRLLVVRCEQGKWALLVDEVLDFERFDRADVRGSQVTVSKSAVHFTDGVLQTPYGVAARIDARRLFEGLGRSLA